MSTYEPCSVERHPRSHDLVASPAPLPPLLFTSPVVRVCPFMPFGTSTVHRDCQDDRPPPHGAARSRNVRMIASCCSTSEWLLWYAQSARAPLLASSLPASASPAHSHTGSAHAPTHGARAASIREAEAADAAWVAFGSVADSGGRLAGGKHGAGARARLQTLDPPDAGDPGGEIPIHRMAQFEPNGAFTLLREAAGTCDHALSEAYSGSWPLKLQQRHGLPVQTGMRLRRLFGQGNFSLCKEALDPTGWAANVPSISVNTSTTSTKLNSTFWLKPPSRPSKRLSRPQSLRPSNAQPSSPSHGHTRGKALQTITP